MLCVYVRSEFMLSVSFVLMFGVVYLFVLLFFFTSPSVPLLSPSVQFLGCIVFLLGLKF